MVVGDSMEGTAVVLTVTSEIVVAALVVLWVCQVLVVVGTVVAADVVDSAVVASVFSGTTICKEVCAVVIT